MNIKKSVLETIGKTPLIEIDRFKEATNIKNNLYTKVEFFYIGPNLPDFLLYAHLSHSSP